MACSAAILAAAIGCSRERREPSHASTTDAGRPVPEVAPLAIPSSASSASAATSPPGPMILLRGGTFQMGTDGVGPGTENMRPAHAVKLPDFRIDQTEVTVAAYRACVNAGGCSAARRSFDGGHREHCTWDAAGFENDPINCVTWFQAETYCNWAGKKLPTEEQWEYAARGRRGRDFPWGMGIPGRDDWGVPEDVRDYVIGCDLDSPTVGSRETCPVGRAPKGNTPEGVQDMAGNVREWTASIYCLYSAPRCVAEERVVRGGDIHSSGKHFTATFRADVEPAANRDGLGFRCAKTVASGNSP